MNTWGSSWGTSWASSWGASPVVVAVQQESLVGGKKAKKRKHWPVFDDDYDEPKIRPVVVSNIVKPKIDDITPQIKAAVAQRQSLVTEIRRLRKTEQLTIVGIAKIAELRHSRSLIEDEIKRLRRLKAEDEEMQAITLIVSELFH